MIRYNKLTMNSIGSNSENRSVKHIILLSWTIDMSEGELTKEA